MPLKIGSHNRPQCVDLTFLTDAEIYRTVILDAIPKARKFVWLATSDLKDLFIHRGRAMVPFLKQLSELADRGVSLRLLHAKEPGPAFQRDFDKFPNLVTGLERLLCPRVHFKSVIIDGTSAYTGSANLSGAGMGAKSDRRRNFENGFFSSDPSLVAAVMGQFDRVWMGAFCSSCDRTAFCAEAKGMRQDLSTLKTAVEFTAETLRPRSGQTQRTLRRKVL